MRRFFAWESLVVDGCIRPDIIAVRGRDCEIILERRPPYCDRGNFIAKLFPSGMRAREIDAADGWPRYFFDLERAKAEVEDWLVKRQQVVDGGGERDGAHGDPGDGYKASLADATRRWIVLSS